MNSSTLPRTGLQVNGALQIGNPVLQTGITNTSTALQHLLVKPSPVVFHGDTKRTILSDQLYKGRRRARMFQDIVYQLLHDPVDGSRSDLRDGRFFQTERLISQFDRAALIDAAAEIPQGGIQPKLHQGLG